MPKGVTKDIQAVMLSLTEGKPSGINKEGVLLMEYIVIVLIIVFYTVVVIKN